MQKHSIGQTIAALRKEKGWTQVQLAEMLQISDKAVSKWEKDKSCPGIDLLPALSDLFDVSIDYLVTGKNSEHSITIMSRIEYCAKTDNPKLAEEIDLSATDETGKNLVDYLFIYEAPRVFNTICDRANFKFDEEKHDINKLFKHALITNRTDILDKYTFKKHKHVNDMELYGSSSFKLFCITDELLDVIALDERVNSETISYLLSKKYFDEEFPYITWFSTLPHLLHRCYLHKRFDLVDLILDEAEKSNAVARNFKLCKQDTRVYVDSSGNQKRIIRPQNYKCKGLGIFPINALGDVEEHYFVRVLKKTIELAMSKNDTHYIARFNSINNGIKDICDDLYRHMERCGWI